MHSISVPHQYFLDETIELTLGPLRLEIIDKTDGSGIPREFVVPLTNTMLRYTDKGFCGTFDSRVSSTHAGVKVWIGLRTV